MSSLPSYYDEQDPDLTDTAKSILINYSNIPESELISHVKALRDEAWEVFQYPCIGTYNFLDFGIANAPIYDSVVKQVKDGATLLDLGCCFGQDLRKLAFDGCPSENLVGTELESRFIDFGYELFKDQQKLKASFKTGDFFSPEMRGSIPKRSFDYIFSGSFFHLFTWDEQVEVISYAVEMLKRKSGSTIFGRQVARDEPGPFPDLKAKSGPMYVHNEASFRKLIDEVSSVSGVKFETQVSVGDEWGPRGRGGWKKLSFIMRYVE